MPGRQQDASFYKQLFEQSHDAIITKDAHARITGWNDAAATLYGWTAEEAIGRPVSIIIPPERRGEEFRFLEAAFTDRPIDHFETERITKAGRRLAVSLSLSPIKAADGRVIGAATIARDISERQRQQGKLRFLAHHDPVTGLFNRARFEEEVEARLRQAARSGRPGALLALDLDEFKAVNDTYGHAVGDALLGRVADALRQNTREIDAVGRLGGDEFAVVMADIPVLEAARVSEKLLDQVSCRWQEQAVTASIGLVPFDGSREVTATDLMIAADTALYDAKDRGRNCVARYSGRRAVNLSWAGRIRHALLDGGLVLEAQPIIDLSSGETIREELLVRMRDERGGFLLPDRFLPTAERFRIVQEIDGWVTGRAIELAVAGRAVAVNLSALSVNDEVLMEGIGRRIDASGADPTKLLFEITESAALSRLDVAGRLMQPLVDYGCSFALDDFGAGFVNFGHLRELPLKYLKIDSEFIRDLASSRAERSVVEAIVSLARGFGQRTIAEGVESAEALAAVRRCGIDFAQGWHVGRPAPVEVPGRDEPRLVAA